MAQFSIDSDISPLKRRHFGSASRNSLSSQDRGYLDRQFGKAESDQLDRNFDIAMKMDQKRNNDLRYEANLLALQTAKEKSANERDAYSRLPQLMGEVNAIKDNAELDPYAKQAKYGELAIQYPHLLTTNKVAGTVVAGAMNVNSFDIKRLENEDRKAYKSLDVMNKMPDIASAAAIAGQDGFSDVEKAWLQGKGRVTDAKERKEFLDWKKTQRDEAATQYKTQQGSIKSIQDEMYGLELIDADKQLAEWTANTPQGYDDASKRAQDEYKKNKPDFTPKLSEVDVLRVQSRAQELNIDPRQIESMTPDQLRIAVIKKANSIDQAIKQKRGLTSPQTNKTAAGGVYKNRNR